MQIPNTTQPSVKQEAHNRALHPCVNFIPPNGKERELEFKNTCQEDYDWMDSVSAKMSCEKQGNSFILYLDVGLTYDNNPDEEPIEAIIIADDGMTPFEAVSKLVITPEP